MKIKIFIWALLVSFLSVHSLAEVHASVHFFHAEDTVHSELSDKIQPHQSLEELSSAHADQHVHDDFSFDTWVCDLYDPLSQAAIAFNPSAISLSDLTLQSFSADLWQAIAVTKFYPAFWGRAPPQFPFV